MSPKYKKYLHPKQQNPALQKITKNITEQKLHQKGLDAVKEKDVYQYYSEFQIFMKWENPPDYKIEPIITNKYHAETKMPSESGEPFIIEISPAVVAIQGDSYKATLYHEFTHIYDDSIIHQEVIQSGIPKTTTWYTEAHAIEIELMLLCGFESVSDRRKIPFDTTIHYCGAEISLIEFGNQKINEYLNHLSAAKEKLQDGINREATTCYAEAIKRLHSFIY